MTRRMSLTLRDVMTRLGMREGFDVGLEMSGAPAALDQMIDHMVMGGKIALLPAGEARVEKVAEIPAPALLELGKPVEGGETPIVDCRLAYSAMDPAIRERFERSARRSWRRRRRSARRGRRSRPRSDTRAR